MSHDPSKELSQTAYVKRADDKSLESTQQLDPDQTVAHGVKPSETRLDRTELLGTYRLAEKLGQGGMGAVYKAVHTQLEKTVAIKVLARNVSGDPSTTERFKREMKAIGRVQHPNVVVAHDGGQIEGEYFLVMEYVDGIDVSTLQQKHGRLPVPIACEIVRQAAVGLQHAHEMGLVHRDIKPGNLMLDHKGVVKVLDLGLARIESEMAAGDSEPDANLTATGIAMGTINYMSPEQALDSRSADARSDIYSLGVTLYKLLSGRLPFAGEQYDTNGKMLVAIMTQTPPSLKIAEPNIPFELIKVVDRSIAKDPSMRIATAAAFAECLAPFAGAKLTGLIDAPRGSISSGEIQYSAASSAHVVKSKSVAAGKKLKTWLAVVPVLFLAAGIIYTVASPRSNVSVSTTSTASLGTSSNSPETQLGVIDSTKVSRTSVDPDTSPSIEATEVSSGSPQDKFALDREIVRWIEASGGQVLDSSLQPMNIESKKNSNVAYIKLTNKHNLSDFEFNKLPELASLRYVTADSTAVDNNSLTTILKCRSLHTLNISGTKLTSKEFIRFSGIRYLAYLRVSSNQVLDEWQFLNKIPTPGVLSIDGSKFPPPNILGSLVHLNALEITGTKSIDESTIASMQSANSRLSILLLSNGKFETRGQNPVKQAATQLANAGWKLSFADKRVWKLGDDVMFNGIKIIESLEVSQLTTADAEAVASLGPNFYKIDLSNCELKSFPECLYGRHVSNINARNSSIDDEMLLKLANRVIVMHLDVRDTTVTLNALRKLKSLQPLCHIVADEINLPSEHRLSSAESNL